MPRPCHSMPDDPACKYLLGTPSAHRVTAGAANPQGVRFYASVHFSLHTILNECISELLCHLKTYVEPSHFS